MYADRGTLYVVPFVPSVPTSIPSLGLGPRTTREKGKRVGRVDSCTCSRQIEGGGVGLFLEQGEGGVGMVCVHWRETLGPDRCPERRRACAQKRLIPFSR